MNYKKIFLLNSGLILFLLAFSTIQDDPVVEKIALQEFDFLTPKLTKNEIKFEKLFQDLDEEMHSLKKNSYFKNFVKVKENKRKVEVLFLEILEKMSELHQLRYIHKDGKEIIRAQRDGDTSYLVEENKLQNKKHRYYFININDPFVVYI